jgi:hypothetical protein
MPTTREETPEEMRRAQRTLRLYVSDAAPTDSRLTLDQWADRRFHDLFTGMYGADGRVPSDGISDIRRKHRRPWRTITRRMYEAALAEVPHANVHAVAELFAEYNRAARIIADRERARMRGRAERLAPYIRAAAIVCTLLLAGAGACGSTTLTGPAPRSLAFRLPPVALDTAGTIPTGPAVRP